MTASAKNKKIVLLILISVLCAAIAGFGAYKILTPQRTTVYVFNANYTAGTRVTGSMLTSVEVDNTLVVAGSSVATKDYLVTDANIDAVLNSAGVLRTDVYSGNILVSSLLSTTGGTRVEMAMGPDKVAVTVGANSITSVTPELYYGCRVNVYANYSDSTVLILQSQRVLSVSYENGYVSGVTLECSAADSLRLIHAYTYGTVHLGLVDASGYVPTTDNAAYNLAGFSVPMETKSETQPTEVEEPLTEPTSTDGSGQE